MTFMGIPDPLNAFTLSYTTPNRRPRDFSKPTASLEAQFILTAIRFSLSIIAVPLATAHRPIAP